jgi:large subunit ribosomal protein L46
MQAAERVIVQTGGINMNTWIVGNAPVGHHTWNYTNSKKDVESGLEDIGEKTFFMKGRIMAGNPDLKVNRFGLRDHQWLSRDEIEKLVNPSYWNSIKNMLPSL